MARETAARLEELAAGFPSTVFPAAPLTADVPAEAPPLEDWTLSLADLAPGARIAFEGPVEHPEVVTAYARRFEGSVASRDSDMPRLVLLTARTLLYADAPSAEAAAQRMAELAMTPWDDVFFAEGLVRSEPSRSRPLGRSGRRRTV